MEYTFTHSDNRKYRRKAAEPIVVESKISTDGHIELSFIDNGYTFIVLKVNDREAAAISIAADAGRANCNCQVTVIATS